MDYSNPGEWYHAISDSIRAEYESRQLSTRILKGKEYVRRLKKPNPQMPFGYTNIENKYVFDQSPCPQGNTTKANAAKDLFQCYLKTRSPTAVVRLAEEKYGIKFRGNGIVTWVSNPVLVGGTPYKCNANKRGRQRYGQIEWDTHKDRIGTFDDYDKICDIIEARTQGKHQKRGDGYSVSGLMVCAKCGKSVWVSLQKQGKNLHSYLKCASANSTQKCGQKFRWDSKTTTADQVEAEVIKALIKKSQEIASLIESDSKDNRAADEPVSTEEQELRAAIRHLEVLNDPDLQNAIAAKRKRLKEITLRRSAEKTKEQTSRETFIAILQDPYFFEKQDKFLLTSIFQEFISQIIVGENLIDIHFKI